MSGGPRRLLVVTGTLDLGGTERHLTEVLPRLDRSQVRPELFVMRGGGVLQPRIESLGVPVHAPARTATGARGVCVAASRLVRLWRRMRPDLVHFFLPEAYLVGATCGFLAPAAAQVMSRRSLNVYQGSYPGIRAVEHLLHRRMQAILGNSRRVVEELLEEGASARRTGLIHNGVDLARFDALPARAAARDSLGIARGTLLLVCVANLIPYKGHRELLTALAGIAAQLPVPWQVALVGRDTGIRAELQALASRSGIGANCRWVGESLDVDDWLAAADIGVLASHEEGFSNCILEMMAAALPVVATRVGGNPDAIEHGESGLLVQPRSPAGLGAALLELATAPERRSRIGLRARAEVASRFSMAQCVSRYEALYRGLSAGTGESIPELISPRG